MARAGCIAYVWVDDRRYQKTKENDLVGVKKLFYADSRKEYECSVLIIITNITKVYKSFWEISPCQKDSCRRVKSFWEINPCQKDLSRRVKSFYYGNPKKYDVIDFFSPTSSWRRNLRDGSTESSFIVDFEYMNNSKTPKSDFSPFTMELQYEWSHDKTWELSFACFNRAHWKWGNSNPFF